MGQTALPDSQWTLLSLNFEDPSSIFLTAPPFMLIAILWIFPVLRYAVSLGVVSQGWVTRLSPAGQGKVIFDWFSRAGAFPFTPTEAEWAFLACSILIPPNPTFRIPSRCRWGSDGRCEAVEHLWQAGVTGTQYLYVALQTGGVLTLSSLILLSREPH